MRSTSACAVAVAAEGAGADVLSASDGVSVSGVLPLSVSVDSTGRAAVLPAQAAVRDA